MNSAVPVRLVETRQFVRNVVTRMPFRYGGATLTRVPILHLEATIEGPGGTARGWAADCLPPGWFDKRPGRSFRDDIASLRWSVEAVVAAALGAPAGSVFEHWQRAYQAVHSEARDETGLTRGFGPALLERSLIDALGKLVGTTFAESVHGGLLGIELGALSRELDGFEPDLFLSAAPLATVAVRHTVGLADPITVADVPYDQRLTDGLPQTLEEYLEERGLRYFKIKVQGDLAADLERLKAIAALLERVPGGYFVSLDGNEQYDGPEPVMELLEAMAATPALARLLAAVEYIEQPIRRDQALEPGGELAELARRKPVIIDESDDSVDSFGRALDLGYAGVSAKNCKGVSRAVGNYCLIGRLNRLGRDRPCFMTGEDLMNTAAIPLQQDLATAALLGLRHVERNGHHYVRGLDHLSPEEIADCLTHHDTLYEPFAGDSGQLRICDGLLDLRSLAVPGYAVAFEPDTGFLTPSEQWRYEDLGFGE